MKHTACFLTLIALLFVLCSCCPLEEMDTGELLKKYDAAAAFLGNSQITPRRCLIGFRVAGGDSYTGSYRSECSLESGRDVVFGGASIWERRLLISGRILSSNGKACIRIRLGADVQVLTPNKEGEFQTVLSLQGGGNYIMVDYENFTGAVTFSVSALSADTAPQKGA